MRAFCSNDGLAILEFCAPARAGDLHGTGGNTIDVGGLSFCGDDTTTELSSINLRSAPSIPPKTS